VVKRKTANTRFTRALKRIADWCRLNRHESIKDQAGMLGKKLKGHCAYYGITGNARAVHRFRHEMLKVWYHWLSRRSQRTKPWEWFWKLVERIDFQRAVCVHSAYSPAANP
jgi:hypothetical protein